MIGNGISSPKRAWLQRALVALFFAALVAGLVVLTKKLLAAPEGPRRQMAKISILPDTPPPPPPPREEPKKEQPKEQPKQAQQEAPKQETPKPPPDQPIKMEGTAGDAPSAFQSGTVTQDYKGGAPTVGGGASAAASDRAQERLYANNARQLLREEIEKHLRPEAGELTSTFAVWVEADGRIRRYEVTPSAEPARDSDVQAALAGAVRELRLPPPGSLAQPMRFRLTLRAQA